MKKLLFFFLCMVALGQAMAKEQRFTLASPNGKLVSHIVATAEEELTYDLVFNGVAVMLPSHVGLNRIYGKTVTGSMAVVKSRTRSIDETVLSPFTRQAAMRDRCNELTLELKNGLYVDFRAYDEGLAYRYRVGKDCTVRFEKDGAADERRAQAVVYNFAGDYKATVPYVTNFDENNYDAQFTSSFENLYKTLLLSQMDGRRLAFLPLLVHAPNGVKVCLTETHLEHFPGLYLKARTMNGQSGVDVRLEGEPRQGGLGLVEQLEHQRCAVQGRNQQRYL